MVRVGLAKVVATVMPVAYVVAIAVIFGINLMPAFGRVDWATRLARRAK